jgi:uncharacterized membrane protein
MAKPIVEKLKAAASHGVTMIFIGIGALMLVAGVITALVN